MPQPTFPSISARPQPSATLAPPSAFNRGGNGTFRNSLRKLPSSFFPKENKPAHAAKDRDVPPPVPTKSPEKTRKGTKARKALGELFGWGNHSNHPAPAPAALAPSPVAKAPTPPPKPAPAYTKLSIAPVKQAPVPAVLRKAPSSRILASKPSNSALSSFTNRATSALKPPQEDVRMGRPSMGEDPFGRRDQGAEVVDVFTRHGVTPSVKSASTHRRESYSSSKALSMKTVLSDEGSVHKTPQRKSTAPSSKVSASPHRRNGHTSSPPPPRAMMVNLPPRASSIGHMLDIQPIPETHQQALRAPSPIAPSPPRPMLLFTKSSLSPKMKREKAKSKVWGFLTGSKKTGTIAKTEGKSASITTPNEPADDNEQYVKINLAPPTAPPSAPTADFGPSASASRYSTAASRSSRPRPPALHISQPSSDFPYPAMKSADTFASRSTIRSPTDATWTRRPIEVTSRGSPSRAPTGSPEGGVWERVAGSAGDRPSMEDPRQVVTALMAPRGVPKRKSLTGLFGVSVKRSMERIRSSVDTATSRTTVDWKSPKLRSLAEEMEEARLSQHELPLDMPQLLHPHGNENVARASPGLRRVASATDKLVHLLSHFDFTPSKSPATISSPAIHKMGSLQSVSEEFNGSPTPMRRFKSAMLSSKPSASPHKSSANVSPLKLALHRATATASIMAAQTPAQKADSSPRTTSMVRKGMRNIFAPPSPVKQPVFSPAADVEVLAPHHSAIASLPPTSTSFDSSSPSEIEHHRSRVDSIASSHGLPGDLRDLIEDHGVVDFSVPSTFEITTSLGLPPPPSWNRPMPRRPGAINVVPAISLPPVPSPEAPRRGHKASPAHLTLDWAPANRDYAFTEAGSINVDFDFTSEYQALDRGEARASFVAAVEALGGNSRSLMSLRNVAADDLPGMLSTADVPTITRTDADDDDDLASDEEWDEDEDEEVETQVQICRAQISPRREPVKGQWAFQQRISTMYRPEESSLPPVPGPAFDLPLAPIAPPAELEAPTRRRGHRRDESGLSIATMSSIGDVIETGIAGEYTNYFDANFTQHLASRDSTQNMGDAGRRAPTRRAHHRRNSSIISVESVGGIELSVPNGPPVSLRNPRRSSYISRHRRNGSSDSAWGRSDWSAHSRHSSTDSTASAISITRLGRPGLGDRMFQLDGGVQLTSITGSPSDAPWAGHQQDRPRLSKLSEGSESTVRSHGRHLSFDTGAPEAGDLSTDSLLEGPNELSFDSLLDGPNELSFDSLLDDTPPRGRPASGDSFFGVSTTEQEAEFFLRGFRPVSGISQVSSSETHVDDTFIDVTKHSEKVVAKEEVCLQADGEDTSILDQSSDSMRRQLLKSSLSRPRKPSHRHRRPPLAKGAFDDLSDTPGLTSSASEASSRVSLDTRFSDFGSFSSRPGRPLGAGHQRQKSSGLVHVAATIREEPSMATLRGVPAVAAAPPTPSNDAVASWLRFQREAESVCQLTKAQYRDSSDLHNLDEWKMPTTQSEIAAFLAKSSAAYKPLAQLPMGRIAHRRKSSLADSRVMMSPYGLPLPRPPQTKVERKKGSLETKFERSNSAGSSTFSFAYAQAPSSASTAATGTTVETPTTASIFAQFTRPHAPSPPSSFSQATTPGAPGSPFRLSLPPSWEPSFAADKATRGKAGSTPPREQRPRVNSGARRAALGWGRKRNSDGPDKIIPVGSNAAKAKGKAAPKTSAGSTFTGTGYPLGRGARDKENLPPVPPMPLLDSRAVRVKTSTRKALAPVSRPSQPRGLRV